jgi:hypothetical protein
MDELIKILNNFDPKKPLDKETLHYYQPRQTSFYRQLETECLKSDSSKVLFTGMIGSGKTTELNYFSLKTSLQIIKSSLNDDIDNIFDLSINDLLSNSLVSFLRHIKGNIANNQNAVKLLYKYLNFDANLNTGRPYNESYKGLITFLDSNSSFKIVNYKEFFRTFNLIVNEVFPREKPVLIVDGLDKLTLERSKYLFYEGGNYIKDLPLKMIITIPFELTFDEDFFLRKDNFYTSVVSLPVLSQLPASNKEYFKEIIRLRLMDVISVPDSLLDTVISYSGGLLRHLILLFREALSAAVINNRDNITRENIDSSIQNLADDYQKILNKDDILKLREFKETKIWINDYKQLIKKQAILYYNTGTNYEIHPVVKKILIDNREVKFD